jgi:hypothetical protein
MQPADTSGFEEELTDTGLLLDLAALLDTQHGGTAAVGDDSPRPRIEMDAMPGLFSGGPVRLRYSLGEGCGPVGASVYDVIGRRVRGLLGGADAPAGTLTWDGLDDRCSPVPSGVYFLRLSSPGGSAVRRVVRVRGR